MYYEYDAEDEVLISIPDDGLPKILYRPEGYWRNFDSSDELLCARYT